MAYCNTNYFLGQGRVSFAPRTTSGAISGGWLYLGDSDKLEVTTKQNFTDIYESCSGNKTIAAHVPIQTDWTFNCDALNFSKEVLALGLYGSSAVGTTGTVTAEAVTAYGLNAPVPLVHPNVSAVVVKSGVTTLTVNTDYTVDATFGTITLISATNLTGPAPYALTVDYSYGATTNVEAFATGIKEFAFRFEGINMRDQSHVLVTVHRVAINLASTLALISTSAQKTNLTGMILPDGNSVSAGDSQFVSIKML